MPKTVDVSDMTLEEAKAHIETKAPKKKAPKKKATKKRTTKKKATTKNK
ncbi:DNA topoisomerase I [Jejuia pallidilutea]|uniref:DNA topoisomerase I n=1 Tax=Jejuia pallidilutea TaxID=504487 RepID=A0A090WHD4_9FLAO|nr:DNA topoisomerase I [Jejuia pallidilutea]